MTHIFPISVKPLKSLNVGRLGRFCRKLSHTGARLCAYRVHMEQPPQLSQTRIAGWAGHNGQHHRQALSVALQLPVERHNGQHRGSFRRPCEAGALNSPRIALSHFFEMRIPTHAG
jgi:hypothetical protein